MNIEDFHFISDHEKNIHEYWIMGHDERSVVVHCATNNGD